MASNNVYCCPQYYVQMAQAQQSDDSLSAREESTDYSGVSASEPTKSSPLHEYVRGFTQTNYRPNP